MHPARRALLLAGLATALPVRALAPRTLQFPRDHGSHPDFQTEWWYVTGHASAGGRAFGFQVTFFRSRVAAAQPLAPSAFAATQLVFAHAAVTDLQGRRLLHDQRIARAGFGVAQASEADTAVRLRDWSLVRDGAGYTARVAATGFTLDLRFATTQPLLLQGAAGLSRKGPDASQASHYYSQPQLAATGRIGVSNAAFDVQGRAWLDHEWSQALLHPDAVGWDWIGMNLDNGGALTAFRLRTRDGGTVWTGGSYRAAGGTTRSFADGEVRFEALRHWDSPLTRARYPVEWRVATPTGMFTVRALLDDQELDSRGSTGAVYWEGVSDLLDAAGARVGRGYLEMTGYAQPLRL